MGIFRAIVPRKKKDLAAVTILAALLVYVGSKLILSSPPDVTYYAETQYPKEVIRGSYFDLNFDLAFGKACNVTARRYIIGSDGIEYLALEDSKEVEANKEMRYTVRIPVDVNIPYGPATIRSDFEYGCDLWSRHIRSIKSKGRSRQVNILSETSLSLSKQVACQLPPEAGFTVVKTHYRKKAGSGVLASADQRD